MHREDPKENRLQENILKNASISMILDSYDDIFSDFDPRPYAERAISDDFLHEAQKVVHEKKQGVLELQFLLPAHLHNPQQDLVIRKRLHRHFHQTKMVIDKERRTTLHKGLLLTVIGFLFMLLASYASLMVQYYSWYSLLLVFLEPGGWFMVWYGLDVVFYQSRQRISKLRFYQKLSRANIIFKPY